MRIYISSRGGVLYALGISVVALLLAPPTAARACTGTIPNDPRRVAAQSRRHPQHDDGRERRA